MTYISFCSGIEAATQAWHTLGWTPKAFCEIDKFPSRVLAHHYPDVPNLGDFTKVDWSQWSADVCVGGTPCQAFSVAGLRKSLADDRGNLSLEFIRAINIIRPRYVVWENVPGVLSTADNAFGCFMAGLVGCEEPIVCEQGWPNAGVVDGPLRRCAWRVLDAQYFGLAQRRKRVFVVASSGDGPHPAEILFEWESLRRDTPPRREAGEGPARGVEIGPSGGSFTDLKPTLGSRCKDGPIRNQLAGAVAMCLNAHGKGGRLDGGSETLVTHSLRADGFDASEDGTGRGTPVVPVAFNLRGRDGGAMPEMSDVASLRAASGGSSRSYVAQTAVRRLTPRECERLQGFPDDYTNIPGAADGPRYKALGNSMAVPVMRWIGRRIKDCGGLTEPTVEHARREQLRAAAAIGKNGWDERGAVLGMGDWMAEEVILEGEKR